MERIRITAVINTYNITITDTDKSALLRHFKFVTHRMTSPYPYPNLYIHFNFKDGILYSAITSSFTNKPFKLHKRGTQTVIYTAKPNLTDYINGIDLYMLSLKENVNRRKIIIKRLKEYNPLFIDEKISKLRNYFIDVILTQNTINYLNFSVTPYREDLLQYFFSNNRLKYFEIKFGITLNK